MANIAKYSPFWSILKDYNVTLQSCIVFLLIFIPSSVCASTAINPLTITSVSPAKVSQFQSSFQQRPGFKAQHKYTLLMIIDQRLPKRSVQLHHLPG